LRLQIWQSCQHFDRLQGADEDQIFDYTRHVITVLGSVYQVTGAISVVLGVS